MTRSTEQGSEDVRGSKASMHRSETIGGEMSEQSEKKCPECGQAGGIVETTYERHPERVDYECLDCGYNSTFPNYQPIPEEETR
jgi:DNA-directed RNA polymerase subunit M/transcription elongation factor TFIIS